MKLVEKCVTTVYNEEETIVGAAKMALHFAEEVWFIIDPETTDTTEVILRAQFPQIHVAYQKIINTVNDTYEGTYEELKGETIRHHENWEYWMNEIIEPGEWFLWMAADERFAPKDWGDVYFWCKFAQQHGYESIYCPIVTFVRDTNYRKCWDFHRWVVRSTHFMKMPGHGWHKGKLQHTGCNFPHPNRQFQMPVTYYHFAHEKKNRIPFTLARDHKPYMECPHHYFWNPMGDGWRTLPNVGYNGEYESYTPITTNMPPHIVNRVGQAPEWDKFYEEYKRDREAWVKQYDLNRRRGRRWG